MSRGSLQPGNLGRWFEQLCRIQHVQLPEIVVESERSLRPRMLTHAAESMPSGGQAI